MVTVSAGHVDELRQTARIGTLALTAFCVGLAVGRIRSIPPHALTTANGTKDTSKKRASKKGTSKKRTNKKPTGKKKSQKRGTT